MKPKVPTSPLPHIRSIGYEEDRGATRGSSRSFKHQHDTDKNLVFLHVFPDFELPQPSNPTGEGGEDWDGGENLSEMYKPEQLCIACSMGAFQEALEQKVGWYGNYYSHPPQLSRPVCCNPTCFFLQLPSWSQKKALQLILKEKASFISNIEVKMAERQILTEEEMVSG